MEYLLTMFVSNASLSYEQGTTLQIAGRGEPFNHLDQNTLRRVALAPNPAAGASRSWFAPRKEGP